MSESLRGQLLIAAPSLFDFFRRTVILVIDHGDEGAFGLILNRTSEARVGDAVPGLADQVGDEELVRIGGPVAPQTVVALGEFEDPSQSPKLIVAELGLVDLEGEAALRRLRIYAGHAGWGPGQLEGELERDAWLVDEAAAGDPFGEGDLWAELLERRGGRLAFLSRMPEDPSLN